MSYVIPKPAALALIAALGAPTVACADSETVEGRVSVISSTPAVTPVVATTPVPQSPRPEPVDTVVERVVTYQEAETAYREGRFADALELFGRYTEQRPENGWGHYMLGLSAQRSGELELAESAYRAALERDPKHVKSMINLTRVLVDTDRPEVALEVIDEALVIDPESNPAYRQLGRVHYSLGDVELAIEAYQEALMIDDDDVWSMNNLGLILIQQGRYEEALLPLSRATVLRPDVAVFQNNLGVVLERTGHLSQAVTAFETAVTLDPSHLRAAQSKERVEALVSPDTVDDFDVEEASVEFLAEIERWREFPFTGPEMELTPAHTTA